MKRYVVFGATGSIGTVVCQRLLNCGHNVSAVASTRESLDRLMQVVGDTSHLDRFQIDVTDALAVANLAGNPLHADGQVDGIIYLVGRCPAHGFDDVIAYGLDDLRTTDRLLDDLNLHVVGAQIVFGEFLKDMAPGGTVTFISSALTRVLIPGTPKPPSWLKLGHHVAAVAALDAMIVFMRWDELVEEKGLIINRIAPAAIDTHFHVGCAHRPPAMLDLQVVAKALVDAATGSQQVDYMMLPQSQLR